MATRSLRVRDPNGASYNLNELAKKATGAATPAWLKKTSSLSRASKDDGPRKQGNGAEEPTQAPRAATTQSADTSSEPRKAKAGPNVTRAEGKRAKRRREQAGPERDGHIMEEVICEERGERGLPVALATAAEVAAAAEARMSLPLQEARREILPAPARDTRKSTPAQVSERPRHDPPPTHKHAQADPGPSNAAAGLSREPDARISRAGRARAASPPVSVDAPSPSASPESGQAARQSQAFLDLMAQYEDLARRYKSLASSKIRDAEDKCQERDRRVAELESATDRLAQHWKQEAERQCGIAQAASKLEEELVATKAENLELKEGVLQSEARNARLEQQLVDGRRQRQRLEERAGRAEEVASRAVEEVERLRAQVQLLSRERAEALALARTVAERVAEQGPLELLTGLRAEPGPSGGTRFADPALGFAFELRPGERSGDASQMAVGEVEVQYVPVAMGGAKGFLPAYLEEEIAFSTDMVRQFLGKLAVGLHAAHKAAKGAGQQERA